MSYNLFTYYKDFKNTKPTEMITNKHINRDAWWAGFFSGLSVGLIICIMVVVLTYYSVT